MSENTPENTSENTSENTVEKKWYIIHTYSAYEYKVKDALDVMIENQNLQDKIESIVIPTEDVVQLKRNKKVIKKRKFFPGYILIYMVIDNETYWLVKNLSGVTGFLGGLKPTPLPDNEAENLIHMMEAAPGTKPKPAIMFEKEENVRIIEGPFANFVGIVEEVNHERGTLKVMVTIFGRSTPVEVDFLQVEKI